MTAKISQGYRWRLLLVAVICLGFGGWSLYDGLYKYPQINRIAREFQTFQQQGRQGEWVAYARQQGWPVEPEPAKSGFSFYAQYIQALITLPIGLMFAFSYIRTSGRWISCEETDGLTLTTSWGQTVRLADITSLNKDRWRTKGIAVVTYQGSGQPRRLILDDWKYDQAATKAIVQALEARLQPQQIVGDKPKDASSAQQSSSASA